MNDTKIDPVHSRTHSTSAASWRALALLVATIFSAGRADAQTLQWASSYSGIQASALEETEGVVADSAGNVYATGMSGTSTIGTVMRTMKLDSRGNVLWNVAHSKASLGGGMWGRRPIAQDAAGNLIVVGAEFTSSANDWNPVVLKLSPTSGATLARWAFQLGPFASFDGVTVDASGIYILAHNNPNNGNPHVVRTLKLATDGTVLWSDSFTPTTFWGTFGSILLNGSRIYTAAGGRVCARDLAGTVLWQKDLIMPNGGSALAADSAGNLYLTTQEGVTKLDPAGNSLGVVVAMTSYVSDLSVDAAGNMYLVGSTPLSSNHGSDILTQKYNASGQVVWRSTYGKNGPYSDNGLGIAVRGSFVYVGGSTYNKNLDMCTLKYSAGN